MRTRAKTHKVYISDDGQEFASKKDCKLHENIMHGNIKICEKCNGKGFVIDEKSDASDEYIFREKCRRCRGKGYLKKKTIRK